ncbi:MAG: hypothetical protein ACOCUC_01020 [bacterium]
MLSYQDIQLDALYLEDGPDTDADGIDCDQGAKDVAIFNPGGQKVQVLMAGVVVTEDCGGDTTKPIFKFDKRPTAGSDTDRGDGDVGELDLGSTEAGKVMYDRSKEGVVIEPGEEVVFELTQRADGDNSSGHVRPFLLVRPVPEEPVNLDNMVESE